MASEQLTPLLSRDQYRALYMQNIAAEISNEATNLGAMSQYMTTGETLQDLKAMSGTLTGVTKESMLAVLAIKLNGYVKQPRSVIQSLPLPLLSFLYVAIELVQDEIAATYGDLTDPGNQHHGGIPGPLFVTLLEGLYKGASVQQRNKAQYTGVPNAPFSTSTNASSFNSNQNP